MATWSDSSIVRGKRRWAFPLVVTEMNSIAAYLIAETLLGYVESSLSIHLGLHFFADLGLRPARRRGAHFQQYPDLRARLT